MTPRRIARVASRTLELATFQLASNLLALIYRAFPENLTVVDRVILPH